jgi:hypothetical protein
MSSPQKRKQQIEQKIRETEGVLSSEADKIPDRIYSALEGMSSMALAWKQHGGASGWSQTLVDNDGNQLFTDSESDLIEAAAEKARPFLESFLHEGQTGGATEALPQMGINPEDVSIDKMYYGLLSKLDSYDTQWREIVNSLGAIKTFNETDQVGVIPFVPPIPYVIPAKLKFPLINTILELLRIMVSTPMLDLPSFRILLSFGIAILDLVRGEWKHAVLSLFGAYSKNAMYIGIVGKILRDAWLLIAPDLRTDLTDAIFKSTKSFVAGYILWAFGTFAPGSMQKIIQTALDKAAEQVENFNKQIEDLEAKVGDVSKTAGITVSFKRVPEGMVPSLDDIQRLQTIARVPAIFCSDEFQKIIEPLLLIPPLRLALELFNIPTIPETKEKMCAGVPKGSIADTVGDAADPDVGIIPGGPADQAQQAAAQAEQAAEQAQAVVAQAEQAAEQAQAVVGQAEQAAGQATAAVGQVQEAAGQAQASVEGAASFLKNAKANKVGGRKSRTRKNKKSTM